MDGEIYADQIRGSVEFTVSYRPLFATTWLPWWKWTVSDSDLPTMPMGLGEPPSATEGFAFQVKIEVTGACRLIGAVFKATLAPKPKMSSPIGDGT
jgi:hypothetical protein